jgi:predicted esterase
VELITSRYSIDKSRIALHAFGTSGPIAYATAFKHRDLFHGIAAVAAPMSGPPPDNEPDFRMQFLLMSGDADPVHKAVVGTVRSLRDMKYPVVHTTIPEGTHKYPPAESVGEVATWIDMLDRI